MGKFRINTIPAGEYSLIIRLGIDTLPAIQVSVPIDGFFNVRTVRFVSKMQYESPPHCFASKNTIELREKLVYQKNFSRRC